MRPFLVLVTSLWLAESLPVGECNTEYLYLESRPWCVDYFWFICQILCHELHFFLYKNQLYKNKEAQNDPKFKNKLRTTLASKSVNILRTSSERHPWCRLITIFLIEIRVLGLKGSWIFENLRAKSFLAVLSNNTRRLTLVRNQVFRYLINNTDP